MRKIFSNFVSFSESPNFTIICCRLTAGQKSEVGSDLARRAVTNDLQSVCNSSPAHAGTLFDRSKLVSCSFLVHLHTQEEKTNKVVSIITLKVTLSAKVFHFCSNLPKNVLNHYPKLYPPKENMLRIVFGTFFREFGANIKNFLRLSHLLILPIFSKYSRVPNRSPCAFILFFGFFPKPVCLIWVYVFNSFSKK